MACPLPPHDWGLTFVYGLVLLAAGLTAGVLMGQKMGPPKNWMEAEEPPDPVSKPSE